MLLTSFKIHTITTSEVKADNSGVDGGEERRRKLKQRFFEVSDM